MKNPRSSCLGSIVLTVLLLVLIIPITLIACFVLYAAILSILN